MWPFARARVITRQRKLRRKTRALALLPLSNFCGKIGSLVAQPHITDQFDRDEQNRESVYKRIGAAALIPDDLSDLYAMHHNAIAGQLPDYPARVAGALYVACRKHLVFGMTALFRRSSSQAFHETRLAIESAGLANAIRIDPESFRVFREDRDPAARKAAQRRFKSAALFVGPPELVRLRTLYNRASDRSHTNRLTFASHVDLARATFSFNDLREQDIPKLATNYLLWICAAHRHILEAADVVFPEARGDLVSQFQKNRQYLGEKIYRFNQQNKGQYI